MTIDATVDVLTGLLEPEFIAGFPRGRVFALVVSSPLSSGQRSSLVIFDATGTRSSTRPVATGATILTPAWHPFRPLLVAIIDDELVVTDGETRELLHPPRSAVLRSCRWFGRSEILVTASVAGGPCLPYVVGIERRAWTVLAELVGDCTDLDPSPDDRLVALVEAADGAAPDAAGSRLWILETEGRTRKRQGGSFASIAQPRWSPDGSRLAMLVRLGGSARWSDNWKIGILSARQGGLGMVGDPDLNYSQGTAARALGWRGTSLLAIAPHHGALRLWCVERAGGAPLTGTDEHVTDFAVAADEATAVITRWLDRPPEVRVVGPDGQPSASQPNSRLAHSISLPGVSRLSVRRQGHQPEALLLSPARPRRRGSVILDLHGGPHGFHPNPSAAGWALSALLTHLGHCVLMPNPRGSTGFGLRFQRAVVGDWAGEDARDVMGLLDEAVQPGACSYGPLGVTGWSYGGYLAAWLAVTTPRFSAAVLGAPITDLPRMERTSDIRDYCQHEFAGCGMARRSPVDEVGPSCPPILLLHSRHDRRCPVEQSLVLTDALHRAGNLATLHVYDCGDHLLRDPALITDRLRRTAAWFDRFLRPRGAVC